MRISPQQYFQGYENQPSYNLPTQKLQLESDYTLDFIIIALVAGAALGIGIASLIKK